VLVNIITNRNLRIVSNQQLVLFLTQFAAEREITQERMIALSAAVEWSFLSADEWNDVNLALFAYSDVQMAKLMRLQNECQTRCRYSVVTTGLISREQGFLRRMERYGRPIAQLFQSSSDFFGHARDYGAKECRLLSGGREIIVAMKNGRGLYLSTLDMSVRTDWTGLPMSVEFVSYQEGDSTLIQFKPI
jgi:hypothetical protein